MIYTKQIVGALQKLWLSHVKIGWIEVPAICLYALLLFVETLHWPHLGQKQNGRPSNSFIPSKSFQRKCYVQFATSPSLACSNKGVWGNIHFAFPGQSQESRPSWFPILYFYQVGKSERNWQRSSDYQEVQFVEFKGWMDNNKCEFWSTLGLSFKRKKSKNVSGAKKKSDVRKAALHIQVSRSIGCMIESGTLSSWNNLVPYQHAPYQ